MTALRVFPIVEGDGEVAALRILLQRFASECDPPVYLEVNTPERIPRSHFFSPESNKLSRALERGVDWLNDPQATTTNGLVLILIDADPDQDGPCLLGPRLLQHVQRLRPEPRVACVIADREYESWFIAAATSLVHHLDVDLNDPGLASIQATSQQRGKKWIQDRMRRKAYRETVDQPKLTAAMDLSLCRQNSPSFDKLCRELEKRL